MKDQEIKQHAIDFANFLEDEYEYVGEINQKRLYESVDSDNNKDYTIDDIYDVWSNDSLTGF